MANVQVNLTRREARLLMTVLGSARREYKKDPDKERVVKLIEEIMEQLREPKMKN